MASKTMLVAQRELIDNVRTKTFWLGILSFPLIWVIIMGVGWVMAKTKQTQVYTVADYTASAIGAEVETAAQASILLDVIRQELESVLPPDHPARQQLQNTSPAMIEQARALMPPEVREQLDQKVQARKQKYRFVSLQELGVAGLPREAQEQALRERVRDGSLFAYFQFDGDPVQSLDGLAYVCNNLTDGDLRNWYARSATQVIQQKRITAAGIEPGTAQHIREQVSFEAKQRQVTETGEAKHVEKSDSAKKWAPVAFVYLLWIAVFTAAQMLLTNTVEEKSNRIIEVLLSSVSPGQLMSGKIWGIGATGLIIVGSWVVFGILGIWIAPRFVPAFGEWNLMAVVADPLYVASFLGYFLTGYLLFAAILVAIGSVCNSLKEAQNLLQPVFLLLMLPLFAMVPIVQEPNGLMARVFTYVPIYTPFAMMNRASGPPSTFEYAITTVMILVSVWLAFRFAGKVFRVGVLMTGNPPKLKEILGWLREKG